MESGSFHLLIDYVGCCGVVMGPEQKAALQTSLVILQNENKFYSVYFWGKIVGTKDVYFIAQGFYKDEFANKKTFYRYCYHIEASQVTFSLFFFVFFFSLKSNFDYHLCILEMCMMCKTNR